MKIKNLLDLLVQKGIDPRVIYTGEGNPEDRYAILEENGLWNVFYSERGERLELKQFFNELDACIYLEQLLIKDATIPFP